MDSAIGIVIALLIGVALISAMAKEFGRRQKIASSKIVGSGVAYPNNFHVLGVGYYHASSKMWFPSAWNEFREERGYYWDGKWNDSPDLRMVPKSLPPTEEVDRVNEAWRKADPDQSKRFWDTVERDGFGTAIRRSEGS
jgi:hypothetical protein